MAGKRSGNLQCSPPRRLRHVRTTPRATHWLHTPTCTRSVHSHPTPATEAAAQSPQLFFRTPQNWSNHSANISCGKHAWALCRAAVQAPRLPRSNPVSVPMLCISHRRRTRSPLIKRRSSPPESAIDILDSPTCRAQIYPTFWTYLVRRKSNPTRLNSPGKVASLPCSTPAHAPRHSSPRPPIRRNGMDTPT